MGDIKETTILKSKNIDKYFNESKRLLLQKDVLDEELKQAKKRVKAVDNEINKLNNWAKRL